MLVKGATGDARSHGLSSHVKMNGVLHRVWLPSWVVCILVELCTKAIVNAMMGFVWGLTMVTFCPSCLVLTHSLAPGRCSCKLKLLILKLLLWIDIFSICCEIALKQQAIILTNAEQVFITTYGITNPQFNSLAIVRKFEACKFQDFLFIGIMGVCNELP